MFQPFRPPLWGEIELLPVNVDEAAISEVLLDPVLCGLLAPSANIPAPEQVSSIPILAGDRVYLEQEPLQMGSLQIGVFQVFGPKWDPDEGVVPNLAGRIQERLTERIRSRILSEERSRWLHRQEQQREENVPEWAMQ